MPRLREQAQLSNGQISGVALDQDGQLLTAHRVQLNRILDVAGSRGVQAAGDTTSDVNGLFSFTGLSPGTFEVEVAVDDETFTTSVELSAGAMVVAGVTVSPDGRREGVHPAVWFAAGAGAGIGVLFLVLVCAYACNF